MVGSLCVRGCGVRRGWYFVGMLHWNFTSSEWRFHVLGMEVEHTSQDGLVNVDDAAGNLVGYPSERSQSSRKTAFILSLVE